MRKAYYQEFRYNRLYAKDKNYRFQHYDTIDACLNALIDGQASFTILNDYQLEQYRNSPKYHNLTFQVIPNMDYYLSIGISLSSDTSLFSIINKAINSISIDELNGFFNAPEISPTSFQSSIISYIYTKPYLSLFIIVSIIAFVSATIFISLQSKLLRNKNIQLKNAIAAKSTFFANMNHDIRTPLNGVIGFTDLAISEKDHDIKQKFLEKLKSSANILLDIVNDTLDLSRIENGKYIIEPEWINGKAIGERVVAAMQPSAEIKGVNLTADFSKVASSQVYIDRMKIEKLLLNLISNAIKFTPSGGNVSLKVELLQSSYDGCNTKIIVSDTGIGIKSNFLKHLFEPFAQEMRSESRNITGSGLGLAIVKKIVDLMDGKIFVDSKVGSGTTFTIYLPLKISDKDSCGIENQTIDLSVLKGKHVLLCEDNDINIEIISLQLHKLGVHVDIAHNGDECLKMFVQSPPGLYHCILTDLRMPIMDGFEATRRIKALSRVDSKIIPIIAMTGDTFESVITKCQKVGMFGLVAKPININELVKILIKASKA